MEIFEILGYLFFLGGMISYFILMFYLLPILFPDFETATADTVVDVSPDDDGVVSDVSGVTRKPKIKKIE